MKDSKISFYTDGLIVETLLSNEVLFKKAQSGNIISSLKDSITNYLNTKIDPNNKAGSLLNILAPGVIMVTLSAMGVPRAIVVLFSLATSMFGIDMGAIFRTIHDKLTGHLGAGKSMTSSQVDEIVHGAVEVNAPATSDAMSTESYLQELKSARLLKLAMINFKTNGLKKDAAGLLGSAVGRKVPSLLAKIIGWIFKIAIASAGLMVAGDVVNKFIGRPNSLDGTIQHGKPAPSAIQPSAPIHVSTQTKFKINPAYHDEQKNIGTNWVENISNDEASISAMLVMFTKEVYLGLNGLESIIRTTPGFQVLANKITFYNHTSSGDAMVFIPKYLISKKQIADMFIDDVASATHEKTT